MTIDPATDSSFAGTAPKTAAAWVADVKLLEKRGELLAAYDLAMTGIEVHPTDLALRHRAILNLIRARALVHARELFDQWELGRSSELDIAALDARMLKEEALAASGATRIRLLARASERYEALYCDGGDYYPGINAASLWLLAGRLEHAEALARAVDQRCRAIDPALDHPYYLAATQAEAGIIVGDVAHAAAQITKAATLHGNDYAALASTRSQLSRLCAARAIDPAILDPLKPPTVIHFTGHIIARPDRSGRFQADEEARVRADIVRAVADVGFGYGSLAAGADILFAEALLARGAEIHIVLPFERESFREVSVRCSGADWDVRFEACLKRASSITRLTDEPFAGDSQVFAYTARLAMGLAVLRAEHLGADLRQVAVWDGHLPSAGGGTGADIAGWRARGRRTDVIPVHGAIGVPAAPTADPIGPVRHERAMLFGDVKGFSKLNDIEMPKFVDVMLGGFASVLGNRAAKIRFANTWGDGLFVVFEDAADAADCALALQSAVMALDLAGAGLPTTLALRLGGHVGPVFEAHDPIIDRINFFGAHVSRTARIEPVTPPGSVFVTEAFAARLALEAAPFICDYAGQVPAAKGYGVLRMYQLRRRGGPA